MRRYQQAFEDTEAATSKFDTLIESVLVGLLVFMPLAFGVVHAWSEEVVIFLSGAVVICFLLKLVFHRNQRVIWTWAYVPLGVFLLIAILQLVPLPAALVKIISPNTAYLKTELLGDLPDADTVLRSMTLSFYPNATKHDLRLVLAVAGVFVVVLNVFRRTDQIKNLLRSIAVIGGIIAVVALGQNLFGNGKIFWFISSEHCKGYSGPFVNYNNYGQFMNLSIGAALGLLFVKLREGFVGKRISPGVIAGNLSGIRSRQVWLLVAMMSIAVATVVASLSRGGMISMLIAIIFTMLILAWRRSLKGRGWVVVVTGLIAFACILYVSFDTVYDRLGTLRDLYKAAGNRPQILKDVAVVWSKFPVLGTGLGTHSVVFPMFDRLSVTALAVHVENEYAQAAEETGLLGLGALVVFGIVIVFNYARSIRSARPAICSAAYGLGFGILAILIHSLSDFGQHMPANSMISAIFCALLLTLARRRQNTQRHRTARASLCNTLVVCTVFVCASLVWMWALAGADNARAAEAHWEKALEIEKDLEERNWIGTDAEYASLISHADSAAGYEPDNIKYRHWLGVYRWRSLGQPADTEIPEIFVSEARMPVLGDIVAELHSASLLCPTYGPTYTIVGQIEMFILNDDLGAEKIRKGYRLAPCDPIACFVAGYLDVVEGKYEDCIDKFEKAVQLDGVLFDSVVNIYINHLSRPHLALLAAGDDFNRLKRVANVFDDMQYIDLAAQAREKMKDLLEAKCSNPDAPVWAFASLAGIYKQQHNTEAAIEFYRRALVLDYGQVQWHLELAKLLAEVENIPEAMRQAKICLLLRPEHKAAEKLIEDFSVHRRVLAGEIDLP